MATTSPTAENLPAITARRTEGIYRALVDNYPHGAIFIFDESLRYLVAGGAGLGRMNLSKESVEGRTVREALPADVHEHIERLYRDTLAGNESRYEGEYLGRSYDVHAVPLRNGGGHVFAGMVTLYDLTERKSAEEAGRESARLHEQIVNNASDIICRTDAAGLITLINPAGAACLKYPVEELVGRHALTLVRPDHRRRVRAFYLRQCRSRQQSTYLEIPVVARDGTELWIGQHVQLTHDDDHITGFQSVARDITQRLLEDQALRDTLDRHTHALEQATSYDPLTGLPNRAHFHRLVDEAVRSDEDEPRLVLILDVDRFKKVNDNFSHHVGDSLLKLIADTLRSEFAEAGAIARVGIDEFAILAPERHDPDPAAAERFAQLVQATLQRSYRCEGHDIYVSVSVGYCIYPRDASDAATLIRHAETALHASRERGGTRLAAYDPSMQVRARRNVTLESSLRQAVERGELILHYQPQVSITNKEIVGVEALVRWQNPELGLVPPAEFIPLAEETGLIIPIGDWVLREACAKARGWQAAGLANLRISVNISPRQFESHGLAEQIERALRDTGLDPRQLDLELTESSIMRHPEAAVQTLTTLRGMGVQVSVDDFGMGYSSLSYLKSLPLNTLKIDRSFTKEMTRDPQDATLVRMIITLARELGLRVIAEGVETEEQFNHLRLLRCDEAQGYLFHKPLTASELEGYLHSSVAA